MSLYEMVGRAYYPGEVGVRDGRDGGITVWVGSGDSHAIVDLTAEQAKELIRIIEAHLPVAE